MISLNFDESNTLCTRHIPIGRYIQELSSDFADDDITDERDNVQNTTIGTKNVNQTAV